ncbi:PP2C family serine/threonine-protein phosphatase [Persicitalea sp.]|uniref:PP2C family protein-serine/threonine phosphatase n=1 Tax=Persicitalea sp. TaxID=3100273 RepID=UPI0035942734
MDLLQIAGQTDTGQRRTDNQDTFICSSVWSKSSALLAVIDGVGGYAGGEQAAAIAKKSIEKYMATPNGDPLSMLREAVVFANNQIDTQRQQDDQLAQMCCVLTTAVADIQLGKLYFVHVGDTRLYRYRQGRLEKLTNDHSLVGMREDANELTEGEAMRHPRRNEILREIGLAAHRVDDPDFLESGETSFQPGDQLLLCSDGLTDMITQAQVKGILEQTLNLQEQLAELIHLANEQGGSDNITIVLARNGPSFGKSLASTDKSISEHPSVALSPDDEAEPSAQAPLSGRNHRVLWAVLVLVVVGIVAGMMWYLYQISGPTDTPETDSIRALNDQPKAVLGVTSADFRLDSLVRLANRSENHRLMLTGDTFRLDKPLMLTDSLFSIVGENQLTVLIPADAGGKQVAIRATRPGTVLIENIVISGFKSGVEIAPETKLRLTKVDFRNVDLPVSALIRQKTFADAVIEINIRNMPDSSIRQSKDRRATNN